MKLDPQQLQAVEHEKGPCLVAAVAGSGKTTAIVHRIKRMIEKGAKPSEILATTFTRRAAKEMNERLVSLGVRDVKVATFHSICYAILREDGKKYGGKWRVRGELPMTKSLLGSLSLPRSTEEGGFDPSTIVNYISWCKNWLLSPIAAKSMPEPIKAYMRMSGRNRKEVKKLAKFYKVIEKYRKKAHFLTYDDILYQCHRMFAKDEEILKKWRQKYRYVIVDEVQDNCFAQHEILRLIAAPRNNVMIVGDLAQCIPAGQKITTESGSVPIERIKVGDYVMSAHGKRAKPRKVIHVAKSYHTDVLEFTTRNGQGFQCTPNHVTFASFRSSSLGASDVKHNYVYLMWGQNLGYRIGISTNNTIRSRAIMEGAHKLWVLFEGSIGEVAHYEKVFSLRYQIPTITYGAHSLNERPTDKQRLSLFSEFGSNGAAIFEDFGISVNRPVWMNWTRKSGRSKRDQSIAINLCMADRRGKSTVHVESRELPSCLVSKSHVGNKGTRRFRQTFNQYKDAKALAGVLCARIRGSFVSEKISMHSSGPSRGSMRPIDAAQLFPGMQVALINNQGHIYYDVIQSRRLLPKKKICCYDLEVTGTANYFVGGICVHNSIYSWRAASPKFMMSFEKEFSGYKVVFDIGEEKPLCPVESNQFKKWQKEVYADKVQKMRKKQKDK